MRVILWDPERPDRGVFQVKFDSACPPARVLGDRHDHDVSGVDELRVVEADRIPSRHPQNARRRGLRRVRSRPIPSPTSPTCPIPSTAPSAARRAIRSSGLSKRRRCPSLAVHSRREPCARSRRSPPTSPWQYLSAEYCFLCKAAMSRGRP